MSHPLQRDEVGERRAKEREKFLFRRFGDDARAILRTEEGRRVLYAFLQDMGVDKTPFSTNAMTQSMLIGKQDAGKWWLNVIRVHCPEIERKMRVEAEKDAKLNVEVQDDDDDRN